MPKMVVTLNAKIQSHRAYRLLNFLKFTSRSCANKPSLLKDLGCPSHRYLASASSFYGLELSQTLEKSSNKRSKRVQVDDICQLRNSGTFKSLVSLVVIFLFGLKTAFCENEPEECVTEKEIKLSKSNENIDNSTLYKTETNTNQKDHSKFIVKDNETNITKDKHNSTLHKTETNIGRKDHSKLIVKDRETNVASNLPVLPNHKNLNTQNEAAVKPSVKASMPFLHKNINLTLKSAIDRSRALLHRKMSETGAPGMAISVSIDGKLVWSEGMGQADVENGVRMSSYSVMRIASISKCLTMVAVGQLIEEGKLDLDAPIQKYVPYFPKKYFDGKEVTITTRQLLTHTSGIRHYELKCQRELRKKKEKEQKEKEAKEENEEEADEGVELKLENETMTTEEKQIEEKKAKTASLLARMAMKQKRKETKSIEFTLEEYYIKETFKSIKESLKLFQDDELLFKPGEDFCYTTHGYTLVSAVVEGASGKKFANLMLKLFSDMDLTYTRLDQNDPLIMGRARTYKREESGKLKNTPYVDNSYKWAGGGFLSNVVDLVKFGNLMLYSHLNVNDNEPKGFLKSSTVKDIWRPAPNTKMSWGDSSGGYGLGWGVVEEDPHPKAFAKWRRAYASHTGGAVGASSVLLILPTETDEEEEHSNEDAQEVTLSNGIVVAIITNLQEVGLNKLALDIATLFDTVLEEPHALGAIGGNDKHKVYRINKL